MRTLVGVAHKLCLCFRHSDEKRKRLERTVARWRRNDKRCYIASTRALVGWSVLDRLGEIAVPTLIVSGLKPYSSSLASEPRLAEIAGAEMVVIEQARHAAPIRRIHNRRKSPLRSLRWTYA